MIYPQSDLAIGNSTKWWFPRRQRPPVLQWGFPMFSPGLDQTPWPLGRGRTATAGPSTTMWNRRSSNSTCAWFTWRSQGDEGSAGQPISGISWAKNRLGPTGVFMRSILHRGFCFGSAEWCCAGFKHLPPYLDLSKNWGETPKFQCAILICPIRIFIWRMLPIFRQSHFVVFFAWGAVVSAVCPRARPQTASEVVEVFIPYDRLGFPVPKKDGKSKKTWTRHTLESLITPFFLWDLKPPAVVFMEEFPISDFCGCFLVIGRNHLQCLLIYPDFARKTSQAF